MWNLVFFFFFAAFVSIATSDSSLWQTLKGDAPLVIAHGGFSGLFPHSSYVAYASALSTSLPNTILWCDVQLTSDGFGVCLPDLLLNNDSDIESLFVNKSKTYPVNGIPTTGWFSLDFTLDDLSKIPLIQGVSRRTDKFDLNLYSVITVQDLARKLKPPGLWLNIQHDAFFTQHKLNMRSFVLSASKSVIVNYISSPEVNFLKSIMTRLRQTPTKLIFRFLGKNDTEPSTNQTYGALLTNLTFVKTFASGILIPKSYIWPVDKNLYLLPSTSVVLDAHKEGLEVYASNFSNDFPAAYDYSYDPVAEYLKFIDNDNFSVDGVLSDFPITPSAAIDCYSHMDENDSRPVIPLVITHEGASGDYPGCTDLAYKAAITDGADILDCPVQMTKDRVPFCLGNISLIDRTDAVQKFSTLTKNIPELKAEGIFSFDLTWSDIQTLQRMLSGYMLLRYLYRKIHTVATNLKRSLHGITEILEPFAKLNLYRNPNYKNEGHFVSLTLAKNATSVSGHRNPNNKNKGQFVSLTDFLTLAKNATSVSGVMIGIEEASFLAEQGLDVTNAVLDAFSKTDFENQKGKRIMIRSSESAVLKKIKEKKNFEFVYNIDEVIRDALDSTILEVKKFASSVVIKKRSVFSRDSIGFLTGVTDVVPKLKAFKLPVYVKLFQNEFFPQAWDFFSDANVELNSFVSGAHIDGVITDFPKTANRYRRNRCLGLGSKTPIYMNPVNPGDLLTFVQPQLPAEAPAPVLAVADVTEPPLPSVAVSPVAVTPVAVTPASSPNGQSKIVSSVLLPSLFLLLATIVLF